jgi:hypothetical protein
MTDVTPFPVLIPAVMCCLPIPSRFLRRPQLLTRLYSLSKC